MKIALINPAGFGTISERGPHIGLAYLAASCRQNGCEVRVISLNNMDLPDEDSVILDLANWGADLIGFTVTSFSVIGAIQMASRIRQEIPGAKIVAGGIHPTVSVERFLEDNHALFDVVVLGEGDCTILEVIACIQADECLSGVPGIAYMKDRKVFKTPVRRRIQKIDELPFPAYCLFEPPLPLHEYYPMITSRGCPYACIFCISKTFWQQRFFGRDPDRVLEEIVWAKKTYGFRELRIYDDNFTQDKYRAIAICKGIVEADLDIELTLVNGIRADSVDEELAVWLQRAGLRYLMVGVEDGDPEVFEGIQKGETLEQIVHAIRLFKKLGIETEATMIIGLPKATYASTMRSLDFLEELSVQGHWIIAVPFKGTCLYEYAKEKGRLLQDVEAGFDRSMVNYPPLIAFDTPEFTKQERLKAFEIVNIASGNYHFLILPEETLEEGGKRILKTIEAIQPERVEYHCDKVNKLFNTNLDCR